MNALKRKIKILELLKEHESVEVAHLTKLLGVSKVTVRADLDNLALKGLLIRTHGGAMLPENLELVRVLANTLEEQKKEKYAICNAAAGYIKPGMNVIIDSGSTTVHLAKIIRAMDITVITNSVLVLQELMGSTSVELLIAGGILRKPSLSLMGDHASYMFDQIHGDQLFLGASGFSIEKGITSTNIIEAETKKHMIRNASQVFLLADSSKLERMFIANVCGWDAIDYFITDALSLAHSARLAEKGVKVIIAPTV
ncbi:MAG: DeoR/GlpR family DNA-binding transcription regulator [Bacilli bacterium]|jgi:DeoR/GlpR family transcriptional regulator of sugar metabolism